MSTRRFRINAASVVLLLIVGLSFLLYFILRAIDGNLAFQAPAASVELETTPLLTGLDHPWDVTEAPDRTIIFTERAKGISIVRDNAAKLIEKPADMEALGEGGMMGLVLAPDFANNRLLYACFMTREDVRLVRWQVADDWGGLSERQDIITGIPRHSSGRHSGCRPRFGPDGNLWVGTGDAAQAKNPQDPKSLGGKILRITRDGQSIPGNLPEPFDPRIYSYGHRNTQGIAFDLTPPSTPEGRPGISGYSVEHGPGRDDEINALVGGNFGWAPTGTYNEAVPMTDRREFPEAIEAVWTSGNPTIAPSGMTFLDGMQWGEWDGMIAMAVLKDRHLRILEVSDDGKIRDKARVLDDHGRLRSVSQISDGSLLITTDNGNNKDQILRVIPK
jgi:glucose/arabinose dehydrogenase